MEFLAILRPTRLEMLTVGPTDAERDAIGRHFAYLKSLTEEGVVVLAGRTMENDATTIGIYVLRAESAEAAQELAHADPVIIASVMTVEVRPFMIALHGA